MAETGTVAITGATGYIGGLLTRRFLEAGWDVVALRRRPPGAAVTGDRAGEVTATGVQERPFVLGEPLPPTTLDGVQALVHCAYDLALIDPAEIEQVNVLGTLRVLDAAAAAGIKRVILVSSMSAYEGTAQVYGRAKLACERAVLEFGGAAIRLGLVYGPGDGGMAGALRKLMSLPLVPLLAGDSHQFTVHEDDAAAGLLEVTRSGDSLCDPAGLPDPIGLAHPEPVPFRRLLDGLARQSRLRPRFVPVPWPPVHVAMRTAERIGVRLPVRSDSLLGLVHPAPFVPGVEVWARLGVPLRRFDL